MVDTPAGRTGSLICWEHFNPLARHALHAQNEEIHIAVWPDMPDSHHTGGSWLVPPVLGENRLIMASIDLAQRYEETLDLDIAGHYARPDVFQLSIDRTRRDNGVHFHTTTRQN